MTLKELQRQNAEWVNRNFPEQRKHHPLLGLVEEVGELAHAELKSEQGIRGDRFQHHAEKVDAVGDIIIYLANYCNVAGINLQEAVEKTWEKVSKRDWRKDPANGGADNE